MNTQSKKALGGLAVLTILFAILGLGAADSAQTESSMGRPGVISQEPAEELEGGEASGSIPDDPQAPEVGPPSEPGEEGEEVPEGESTESQDYDPWEPFNERTFAFNRQLDRYVLKPAARGWNAVLPDEAQRALGRAFTNVGMPKRFVNSLFQLKLGGAGRELTRFVLNSTLGIGGFFDAGRAAGLEPSNEDTGQTLGSYGVGQGPYVVIPFLRPLTVRDGIGYGVDALLDPLSYVAPFAANAGMTAGETVNDRSLNLEVFEDVEESTLDLYSAVRNGYLQRRQKAVEE